MTIPGFKANYIAQQQQQKMKVLLQIKSNNVVLCQAATWEGNTKATWEGTGTWNLSPMLTFEGRQSRAWQEFSLFFLAWPSEIIFYFSFSARNTNLLEKYSRITRLKKIYSLSRLENKFLEKIITCIKKIEKRTVFFENISSETNNKIAFLNILARIVFILILIFATKPHIKRKKFLFSSRNMRSKERNSHSRPGSWKKTSCHALRQRRKCLLKNIA